MTRKEVTAQAKVGVGIDPLWTALAKDLGYLVPKIIPNLVKDAQVIEGDGGIGTVLLFHFGSDVAAMSYQKEKIVELDESLHQIGLQVVEGGHLNHGFAFYKTSFQLSSVSQAETLIDVKVVYETETEETHTPMQTKISALAFIQALEKYLLDPASA